MTSGGVVGSALWAAYGDALGFLTELVPVAEVRRRTGGTEARTTIAWTKRIGGRFGLDVELPAGTYSDDTQLRLATSRAIRGDGRFDVEVFSKIELPVWLSYALGAGLGTRDAASALARPATTWSTNFHKSYISGGGNGAAMRIQPHVWAAESENFEAWLPSVLRNALTTHGHPRGIFGAAFHAAILAATLRFASIPSPDVVHTTAHRLGHEVPKALHADRELREFWIPRWEERSKQSLHEAFMRTAQEVIELIAGLSRIPEGEPTRAYQQYVDVIDAADRGTVGSGTKTATAAYVVAWLFRDRFHDGMIAAANAIGTDTDTIATMAGAILGCVASAPPPGDVQDVEYIVQEAERCVAIARGESGVPSFRYPDLLMWRPPENANAVVGTRDGSLQIAGLGSAASSGPEYVKDRPEACWRWVRSAFGQRFLIKTRRALLEIDATALPMSPPPPQAQTAVQKERAMRPSQRDADRSVHNLPLLELGKTTSTDVDVHTDHEDAPSHRRRQMDGSPSLHEITKTVIDQGFPPALVGEIMLKLIDHGDDGIAEAIGFAAIIAKARVSRQSRRAPS